MRVLLAGAPGTAKTAMIEAAAARDGRRVMVFRAALADRCDAGGALVPDAAAGITRALPLEFLAEVRRASSAGEKMLVFLDDLGQAPVEVQSSLMRWFDRGHFGPSVLIWAATNRAKDKAGVAGFCEPLRSRFDQRFAVPGPGDSFESDKGSQPLCEWKELADEWCDWATDAGKPVEVVAWHRSTGGSKLYDWKPHADPAMSFCDFRSWDSVSKLWAAGLRDLRSIAAAIGKAAASEFTAFARLSDKLPTPDEVWMGPQSARVPVEAGGQFLIASMLVSKLTPGVVPNFLTYIDRLPRSTAAYAARDAYRKLGAKIAGTAAWARWYEANKDLFETN